MKALSLRHKQGWPFMHGYYYTEFTHRNACAVWVYIRSGCCPPRYNPWSNNQTSGIHDVMWKWSIALDLYMMSLNQQLTFYQLATHETRGYLVLRLLCIFCVCFSPCVSPLITCTIIISHTLFPYDLTLVDFGNLDSCFV